MFLARHAQVAQNNKFAISLQYVKKEVSDEVDCLDADKHERLLQVDTMILMGIVKHSQISQNSTSLQCLFNILKKKLYKVDFLHADEHQNFLLVDFNTLDTTVSCNVILSL